MTAGAHRNGSITDDQKKSGKYTRVQCLEVGPEGYLASGGFDGCVYIWGAKPNM